MLYRKHTKTNEIKLCLSRQYCIFISQLWSPIEINYIRLDHVLHHTLEEHH